MANRFFAALTRRKRTTNIPEDNKTKLARVLTLLDLTALGVGSTLGLGVYVLAGAVAKSVAGPAVCISFLVAAIASAVAGICYAEFASRVPKAGSAYVYSYVTVGEFIAYIIGWNLILEYIIGTASVARGFTGYLDALFGDKIKHTLTDLMPIGISFLSPYPDFLSFGFILLLTVLLSFGVKESTRVNNILTAVNLTTVVVVLVAGSINADTNNWKISKEDIPDDVDGGEGGFLPFGVAGIMAGAAKCFYGFVGFDGVATTGEEAKNPQRDIPLAIVFSLLIIFMAYFGVSTVLTMAWPYYDQDPDAPLPYIFDKRGWIAVKWIVTIGALCALSTSLLGAMFPLPRVLYAMADDGVIFKALSKIDPRFKTPLLATIISGILAGAMAAIFDLQQLIDMMSIGTLLAYTIVAICVLILRYKPTSEIKLSTIDVKTDKSIEETLFSFLKDLFNLNMNKYPDSTTFAITNWCIGLFSIAALIFNAILINEFSSISSDDPLFLTLFVIVTIIMVILIIIIARQPVENSKLAFKVPFVPYIPCISVIVNLYLMLELDLNTWIRFIVWLIIGFLIYFFYGIKNSKEGYLLKLEEETSKTSTNSLKQNTKL